MASIGNSENGWIIYNPAYSKNPLACTISGPFNYPEEFLKWSFTWYPNKPASYFNFATYTNGILNISTCLQNGIGYLLVVEAFQGVYYYLDFYGNLGGYPLFYVKEIGSGSLTYFALRDPRKADNNIFIIEKNGAVTYAELTFTRDGKPVKLPCSEVSYPNSIVNICPCSSGDMCNSSGNCEISTCQDKPCGGNCPGYCPEGKVCRQNENGVWTCSVDCTEKPCGGECHGTCEVGICVENGTSGTFICEEPCSSGVCSGECYGLCPTGEECAEEEDGVFFCKTVEPNECTDECSRNCEGICPDGQDCLEDNNGFFSCVGTIPEEEKEPIWKLWWFWLVVIGGFLLIVIILFILWKYKKSKDKPVVQKQIV